MISPMHFLPAVQVSPELILLIFLPALLFEASWNLKLDELRENMVPILVLAVPASWCRWASSARCCTSASAWPGRSRCCSAA